MIITHANPDRLHEAGVEPGASIAVDATDVDQLARFFDEMLIQVDHVMVTGRVRTTPLPEIDLPQARRKR